MRTVCFCFILCAKVSVFLVRVSHSVLRGVPLLTLILYHKSGELSRGFRKKFALIFTYTMRSVLDSSIPFMSEPYYCASQLHPSCDLRLVCSPLDYINIIPQKWRFVKRFWEISHDLFCLGLPLRTTHIFLDFTVRFLLTTIILYHTFGIIAIGKITKYSENF